MEGFIEPGQTWTVTVSPSDGKQYGGSAVVVIQTMNEGGAKDTNNDGIVDVSDMVRILDYILKKE